MSTQHIELFGRMIVNGTIITKNKASRIDRLREGRFIFLYLCTNMKADIGNRADIKQLIDAFYMKVRTDDVIGYLFNEVANVNWEHHLPRMYDFWESILFQSGGYKGNPIPAHMKLHEQSPLSAEHFERWVGLFKETVDELYEGEKAEMAKQRAMSIATIIQIKVQS